MNVTEIKTAAEAERIAWRVRMGMEPQPSLEEILGAARFYLSVSAPRQLSKAEAWTDAAWGLFLAAQVLPEEQIPNLEELGNDGNVIAQKAKEWFKKALAATIAIGVEG